MRRYAGTGVLLAVMTLAAGCQEDLVAPGAGACPAFCPPEQVAVVDSMLLDAVVNDSSYVGYVLPHEAGALQLALDPGGTVPASRGILRFVPYAERLLLGVSDTTTVPVVALDSFEIEVTVVARGDSALELAFYRLPATVDTSTTFAALDPYFADSTRLGTLALPDSLISGALTTRFAADAFPTFDQDGRVAAVGVELRSADRGFVTLSSVEGLDGAVLTRFVQVDSAGVQVPRTDGKLPQVDTYTTPALPAVPADLHQVGGVPSARALLRFALPSRILDSSTVVRATLILVPAEATIGAPGDTLRLLVQGLAVDVGAKSPLLTVAQEDVASALILVRVGSADTVRVDLTDLVSRWSEDETLPRAVMVRSVPEGNTFARGVFGSTASAAGRPALQVTFVPRLGLGGR
jgi:hypothetical protein